MSVTGHGRLDHVLLTGGRGPPPPLNFWVGTLNSYARVV